MWSDTIIFQMLTRMSFSKSGLRPVAENLAFATAALFTATPCSPTPIGGRSWHFARATIALTNFVSESLEGRVVPPLSLDHYSHGCTKRGKCGERIVF